MALGENVFSEESFPVGGIICHPDLPTNRFKVFEVVQETAVCVIHAIEVDDQNPLRKFASNTQKNAERAYSLMTHSMTREIRGQMFKVIFYVPTDPPKEQAFGLERTTHLVPMRASTADGFEVNRVH